MAFNLGINVIETDGSASPAIEGAPTSVAGLLLRSRRGPTDRAIRVSNFQQFADRFGAHDPRFVGAYVVEGFFSNSGQEAWIARVLGAGGAAASVTVKSRTGNDTLTIAAGFRGEPEAGEWGNELSVSLRDNPEFQTRLAATLAGNQPARLRGTAIGATVNLSTNAPRTLTLAVDDPATSVVVTLDRTTLPVPALATAKDVADAINAQAGALVVAGVDAGSITIVSRRKGDKSKVETSAGTADTRDLLGFAQGNTFAVGANGAVSPYNQVQVRSIAGLSVGDRVRLDDGISESWLQITGFAQQNDNAGNPQYLVQFLAPAKADQNEFRLEDQSTLSSAEFDLLVNRKTPADARPQQVESWEKLTLDQTRSNYAPLRVNSATSGSGWVVLTDLNVGPFSGSMTPAAGENLTLGVASIQNPNLTRVRGDDGAAPATGDYRAALSRFNTIAIQLLAASEDMPDGMLRAVTRAALDYCAGPDKGDCMFVGHTSPALDEDGAKSFGQDFRASKVYGALYWPWITVTDPLGAGSNPTRVIPPTGHVLGVYTRTDQLRGIWKAPAGQDALLRGALAVERDVTDIDHTDLVKNGSINGIRSLRGTGIVIDASRTLSTDNRWFYVNVRLLFNFVKASLRDGLRWVKQEPNREALWNRIKFNTVTPFLLRLFQGGAFGPGKPEDVFTVVCGAENNPNQEIVLGNLHIEVYFFPSRPAETIIITVGQQEGRSSAGER